MNTNTFIMLFAIYSIATGLVVETIKDVYKRQPMDHIQPKLVLMQNLLSNLIAHWIKTRLSIIYNSNQVRRHNLNQLMNSIILKQITDENTRMTIL